ncbi:MAG: hypothetical protein PHI83_10055 [Sphaerochaetaceae bacterium]|nr:hypothetical protein [Sphaerochaetaceae bacterium]
MIVAVQQFNSYSGNCEDSQDAVSIKTMFLKSAQEICDGYLGFEAETKWSAQEMPEVVRLSILRVATLMLSESGGNIGLTGKSFDGNSRTFINYSNYRKYLQPLDPFRNVGF